MEIIVTTLEIIGAIAFAVSGALVGIRKNMDVVASVPPYIFTKVVLRLLASR